MIINDSFPKFDLPIDFIADDSITGDILNYYSNFPCKIKAGVFVLCTEGMVKATINLLEVVIRKNDLDRKSTRLNSSHSSQSRMPSSA